MSTLKDLLRRIKSIRSTQKITAAMKMVAASKLRRTQTVLENFRTYYQGMEEMVNLFFSEELDLKNWPFESQILVTARKAPPLFLVMSTNRGLCGGYNSHLIKILREHLFEISDYRLAVIGRKGREQLKNYDQEKILTITSDKENPSFFEIAEDLKKWLEQGLIGSVKVIFYTFKNVLHQTPQVLQLVPFISSKLTDFQKTKDFLKEPKNEILGPKLLEDWLITQLQNMCLESSVCEHAARMIAMEGATRNAGEMLKKLQASYNRTRQAQITNQLIEIISAAQAL